MTWMAFKSTTGHLNFCLFFQSYFPSYYLSKIMIPTLQSTWNIKLHNGGKKSMIMYTIWNWCFNSYKNKTVLVDKLKPRILTCKVFSNMWHIFHYNVGFTDNIWYFITLTFVKNDVFPFLIVSFKKFLFHIPVTTEESLHRC
jgi:hypothetical protein